MISYSSLSIFVSYETHAIFLVLFTGRLLVNIQGRLVRWWKGFWVCYQYIGLGIEEDCLLKTLRHQPRLRAQSNFYPPSPDPEPELTLGLPVHTDFNALTIVLQSDVSDLLVIKDGKWVAVPVNPNAFVINLGDQIQVSTVCFSYSLSTFFYKTYASRD